MVRMTGMKAFGHRQRLAVGAALLVAAGAAGGAGAVAMTRPPVEMAPTVATPIARLGSSTRIVTVKGRVAEVFGDRFVVQDASGRAMIDAGHDGGGGLTRGAPVLVQGRYDEGQLRAHFLVGPSGAVEQVGPGRPHGHGHGPHDRGPDAPPPPGAGPAAGGPGAPPPPLPAASRQ